MSLQALFYSCNIFFILSKFIEAIYRKVDFTFFAKYT